MAGEWSSWKYSNTGSGAAWRVGVEAVYVGETSTNYSMRVNCYLQMHYGFDVSFCSASCQINDTSGVESGNTSASVSNYHAYCAYGRDKQDTCCSFDVTVSKNYGYERAIPMQATFKMAGGNAAGSNTAYFSLTIGARPYETPRPPLSPTSAKLSDTSVRISWQTNYDSSGEAQPWQGVYVYRSTDDGSYVQVGRVTWDITSYTDNGLSDGHTYRWQIASYNQSGSSSRVTVSGSVSTVPKAPSSVNARALSATSVQVTATASSRCDGFSVERMGVGTGWTSVGKISRSGGYAAGQSGSLTDANAPGGEVVYRASSYIGSGSSAVYSKSTNSNRVTTVTTPLAPSVSVSSGVLNTIQDQVISWTPSHPDGTAQTAAQIQVSNPSGSSSTYSVTTATKYTYPATTSTGTYQVRVRTKGLASDYGPWSAWRSWTVAYSPAVAITSPSSDGATVKVVPLVVSWVVSDKTGVAAQSLTVSDSSTGTVVYSANPPATSTSWSIPTVFSDSVTYLIRLTVRGGSGIEASFTRRFVVSYSGPAKPSVYVSYDIDKLSATVVPSNGSGSSVATSSISVSRVLPDGNVTELGTNLQSGQAVADAIPPLNTDFVYRVTAHASSGATSSTDYQAHIDSDGYEAFNFGQDASRSLLLRFDASGSESVSHSGEQFHFALGDNTPSLPTFYPDGDMEVSGQHSYVTADKDTFMLARSLSRLRSSSTFWFRDYWGNRAFCTGSWSTSYSASEFSTWEVSCDVTECVWEEPVSA